MSSTAELSLVIKAKNLAGSALSSVESGLGAIGDKASAVAGKLKGAFSTVGNAIGNIASDVLVRGDDIGQAAQAAGLLAAGQMVEGFSGQLLAKLAGSSVVTAISGALAGLGTAMGGLIAAAIPIGMALLPVLLVAAIVAAIVFLIANPDIASSIAKFAGDLIGSLIGFLAELPGKILDVIVSAFTFAGDIVSKVAGFAGDLVAGLIRGLWELPGKIADAIGDAFRKLNVDVGPFHIRGGGITVDLPNLNDANVGKGGAGNRVPGHAAGGWIGLNGPELGWFGERGPEYVVSNDRLGRGMGGAPVSIPVIIDGREVARIVDEHLFYDLQRAAPTADPV